MFHAQNPYMTAIVQPMNGRATPQDPIDWSGEISNQPTVTYGVMNGAMNTPMNTPMNNSMNTAMSSPVDQTLGSARLRMKHNLPVEVVTSPTTSEEAYRGSMKALLTQNLGNFIVATYLVGTQGTTTWEGYLFDVGNDYMTIYQESRDRYVVTDIYSLKFVEFYDVERQKLCRTVLAAQGL